MPSKSETRVITAVATLLLAACGHEPGGPPPPPEVGVITPV